MIGSTPSRHRPSHLHSPTLILAILLVLPLVLDVPLALILVDQGIEGGPDHPHERWREGPVRYIITAEEDREFKQLDTDEDRARFIERFWARRDPEPRTLLNEFRHQFWNRVVSANGLFVDSTKPGWKTDMGRYYILLGPPDDRDTTLEQGIGFGQTGVRGAIVWRYRHAPTETIGTGLTLVFVKDASGEYRTTTDPGIVERVLSSAIRFPASDPRAFGFPLPQLPARVTELQLLLDLGRLEEVPSEEDLLTAIVTAEEFYGIIPFSARYDFFASDGAETIVATTLHLHPDPLDPLRKGDRPEYLIVGRFDREDGEETLPIFLRESDFRPGPANADRQFHGPFVYQVVTSLGPGRYRVSFAAFDSSTRRTGTYSDLVEVPGFTRDSLSLSSLCLSETIEPVSGTESPHEPYIIGQLKVTPRLLPTYRNGDTFAVYYQVYSATNDPQTQTPELDIEYQFLVRQGQAYMPIGAPIRFESVRYPAQGWSFPLRNWPAGDFKLRVLVTDLLSGASTSREITFKVL